MSILKVNKIQDTTGDDALTFDSSGNTTVNQTLTTTSANITTGGTNNLTISDGDLVIGTAGHGIDFSINSHLGGMTSELLDGYEEGSWTPTLVNGWTSITYADQKGRYVKIGSLVWVCARIGISAGTSNSNAITASIPFTPSNWTGEQPAGGNLVHSSMDEFKDGHQHQPYVTGGSTEVTFIDQETASATTAASNYSSNKFLQFFVIYTTGLS